MAASGADKRRHSRPAAQRRRAARLCAQISARSQVDGPAIRRTRCAPRFRPAGEARANALTGYVSDGGESADLRRDGPAVRLLFRRRLLPGRRLASASPTRWSKRSKRAAERCKLKTRVDAHCGRKRPRHRRRARRRPRVKARAIVSNADVKRTFLELVGRDKLPARLASPDRRRGARDLGLHGPSRRRLPSRLPAGDLHLVDRGVGVEC